jgi:hypothetical protein
MHAMPSKTLLRILIVAEVVGYALGFVASFILESTLPEPLRAYHGQTEFSGWVHALVGVGLCMLVLVAVVARIGLFFFWRPARPLYFASMIGALLMAVLGGPDVSTGWEDMLDTMSAIICGIIFALIYFSPLRDLYAKKQPNTY